jgi:hypothetical protein
MSVYPEHPFIPWKFSKLQSSYWDDMENRRRFFDWLGKELSIHDKSDWYLVTKETVQKFGGSVPIF